MASVAQEPDKKGPEKAEPEVKKRERLVRTSHSTFLNHNNGLWWKIALVLTVVLFAAYFFLPVDRAHYGSTWLGYTMGTIGAVLILWLTMLGLRKRAITPGRWSLKSWTSAHVWLGLWCALVGTLHSGFDLAWNLHTLAWALMMIVILSGVLGIYLYSTLPQKLSENRFDKEGAITEKQMIEQLRSLDRQLNDAAQPLNANDAAIVDRSLEQDPFSGNIVNRLSGKYPGCGTAVALGELQRAAAARTRTKFDSASKVEGLLERKLDVLTRMRRHLRIKSWLQVWLYIHVPVTFALIAALSAHIISVFFYW
jgi:hypothetical protein